MNKIIILIIFISGCTAEVSKEPTEAIREPNLILACPGVMVSYAKNVPHEDIDEFLITTAMRRCGHKYPNSPCLYSATKIGLGAWNLICGAKK